MRAWVQRKLPYIVVSFLTLMMVLVFLWNSIFITIKPGEAGVLFRRFSGTEIDYVYPEGLHIISPLNIMHIYNVRKQVTFHEFNVLTNKGLSVHMALAIRYQPEYDLLGVLHQEIGPEYVTTVIIPQTESVMRKELGQYTAEQIYTNEAGLLTKAILLAIEEVGRNFVEVKDIIIRNIRLPETVKAAIEDKLTEEQRFKAYEFRLQIATNEAKRKRIEAEGIRAYQAIVDQSLTERLLKHQGIQATLELAKSDNAKVVIVGSGENGLPIILGNQ